MEEPRFSITPQPIIAEILAGLATIAIIGAGYCFKDQKAAGWLLKLSTSKVIGIAAAVFALSWIVGTFLDTCRDLFEWLLDICWPLNWEYLLIAAREDVERLNDWFLAYYLLTANYFVGTLVVFGCVAFKVIAFPLWASVAVGVFGGVCLISALLLRKELREIMGLGLPHDRVFTRLKPSEIHRGGVGVFAIRNIKKGTYLFEPDDLPIVYVDAAHVSKLPAEIRNLYYDFGPLKNGKFPVPTSFNKLTVSWYLNEPGEGAEVPNVKCGADLRFYASSDINVGEELTVDYGEYCEQPPAE